METIIIQETDNDMLDLITLAFQLGVFEVCSPQKCNTSFFNLIDKLKPNLVMVDNTPNDDSSTKMCRLITDKFPRLPVIALKFNDYIFNQKLPKYGVAANICPSFDLHVAW